jgi:hypothetical protein
MRIGQPDLALPQNNLRALAVFRGFVAVPAAKPRKTSHLFAVFFAAPRGLKYSRLVGLSATRPDAGSAPVKIKTLSQQDKDGAPEKEDRETLADSPLLDLSDAGSKS